MTDTKSGFTNISSVLARFGLEDKGGYITKEFQDYGYRLAVALDDMKHKSLYIKMAKSNDRNLLQEALSFVTDAHHAKSKARLFMWKVRELKNKKAAVQSKDAVVS
ncbi:MAG: hypothetical protein GW947_03620 [Candidatus Pacebacteria bacterium]|nr:hypothetical protein [Candidatus Paceibacterota bacterium]